MSYKILTRKTTLFDVSIIRMNSTGEYVVIKQLPSESVDYIKSSLASLWKSMKNDFNNSGEEIVLSFSINKDYTYLTLKNNKSLNCGEWYCADVTSKLFDLSILYCRDIAYEVYVRWLKENNNPSISVEKFFELNMRKELTINKLYDLFVNNEFKTSSRSRNDIILKSDIESTLSYIPTENLIKLVDNFSYIKENTVTGFLNEAAKSGFLTFKPYITKNAYGTPTLVLKYNRFVHLFRGYNYQCSYTANGIGEYSSAGIRIDHITKLFDRELRECKLLKMLYYMNLITCCSELDSFNKLLKESPEVVDKFMRLSTSDIFDNYDVEYVRDMTNIFNFLSQEGLPYGNVIYDRLNSPMLPDPKEVLRINASDTSDYGRLKIYYPDIIGIEVPTGNLCSETLLIAPKVYEGFDSKTIEKFAHINDMDVDEYKEYISSRIFGDNHVFSQLVAYLLNSCGFVINYMVVYPINNNETMRAINSNGVEVLKNLGSINIERLGFKSYDKYRVSNIKEPEVSKGTSYLDMLYNKSLNNK